jgi:hypothetical protein
LWVDEDTANAGGHGGTERESIGRGENWSDGGNSHRSITAVSHSVRNPICIAAGVVYVSLQTQVPSTHFLCVLVNGLVKLGDHFLGKIIGRKLISKAVRFNFTFQQNFSNSWNCLIVRVAERTL